jgi:sulfur transfer complex TusBCD TusB component (DsrH family)
MHKTPQRRLARPAKSSLAIVEQAFRGSLEEQYGHIVWLSEIMRTMGADHDLLLRGNAVQFAVRGQRRLSLTIGDSEVTHLSHYESSVVALKAAGAAIYAYRSDLERLDLQERLMPEVTAVDDADVVALCEAHHHLWYW